jgi:hypothetical protein
MANAKPEKIPSLQTCGRRDGYECRRPKGIAVEGATGGSEGEEKRGRRHQKQDLEALSKDHSREHAEKCDDHNG